MNHKTAIKVLVKHLENEVSKNKNTFNEDYYRGIDYALFMAKSLIKSRTKKHIKQKMQWKLKYLKVPQ